MQIRRLCQLALLAGLSQGALADTQSLTMIGGGPGPVGTIDPYSEGSTDGGVTWGPTYYVGAHPWGFIPGVENWINVYPSQTQGLHQTNHVRIRFNLPEGFTDPNLVLQLRADNVIKVYLNGTYLAQRIQGLGASDGMYGDWSPAVVNPLLEEGINEFTMELTDMGGLVAFQYLIDLTFEADEEGTVGQAGDTDVDGLTDAAEAIIGTDPFDSDTDNDGILDGVEVGMGTDPLSAPVTDSDNDGVADEDDTFPNDPAETADSDNDGVGDNADQNDGSILTATVIIGGVDSGIANTVGANGVSLADQVTAAAGSCTTTTPKNHGAYVSCVAKALNTLLKAGIITAAQKDALQSAAGRSSIGKK